MKKILFISSLHYPHVGGIETMISELSDFYHTKGIETISLTKKWPVTLTETDAGRIAVKHSDKVRLLIVDDDMPATHFEPTRRLRVAGRCQRPCRTEWRGLAAVGGVRAPAPQSDRADHEEDGEEVERLGDHFEEKLEAAGFFFPATKAAGMRLNLRNMWGRLGLTRAEVQTFHGMLRQIAYQLRQQND